MTTDPAGAARLTFTGTGVSWIGSTHHTRGIATVHLDGEQVATIDLTTEELTARRVLFSVSGLTPATEHVLEVRATGTAGATATDRRVGVDAYVVLD